MINQNNYISNWKRFLGFRNMQEKLEKKYLPSAGVHGVVTEPVHTGAPLTIELVEDTEVADETEPDEELLSPF